MSVPEILRVVGQENRMLLIDLNHLKTFELFSPPVRLAVVRIPEISPVHLLICSLLLLFRSSFIQMNIWI